MTRNRIALKLDMFRIVLVQEKPIQESFFVRDRPLMNRVLADMCDHRSLITDHWYLELAVDILFFIDSFDVVVTNDLNYCTSVAIVTKVKTHTSSWSYILLFAYMVPDTLLLRKDFHMILYLHALSMSFEVQYWCKSCFD